jgi:uncharacterized protein YjgD (DUF1641 family)
MEEKQLQEQISALDKKLDAVLEFVELQARNREEFDDLVKDVNIVAKDVFQQSVTMLDKAQVELDSCSISCLLIRVLQNLETFHEMLEMMESARDFMKDVSPILHQVGLDAVNKMNEFDRKGYFEYIRELGNIAEKWMQAFTAEDLRNLGNNMENLAGILRNLTDPQVMGGLNSMTKAIATVKPDERLDDKSLWKILLELRSPEVRKSLSYSLRLMKEINKSQINKHSTI